MSNIYIQEPPTFGKVLLITTVGDIDIELWSKETPKACRNFVQLCMEGYYNGVIFHRVVRNFIVQGGDPTGTGEGGESIYGKPFRDEFHSRLRFNRRGLVGMANAGPNDNGSQFFFTLGASPELDKKHTLFGKVTGATVFNMLKLGEADVDKNEKPRYPLKILKTKVLLNPFNDIVPRMIKKLDEEEKKKNSKAKATKNFNLLSFGEEAEEDEEEVIEASKVMKGRSKSSHDLTDDPLLSSVPAVKTGNKSSKRKDPGADAKTKKIEEPSISSEDEDSENSDEDTQESAPKKLKTEDTAETDEPVFIPLSKKQMEKSNIDDLKKQARHLKREIFGAKKAEDQPTKVEEEKPEENEPADPLYTLNQEKYISERKTMPKRGTSSREAQTLALLEKFKSTLHSVTEDAEGEEPTQDRKEGKDDGDEGSDEDIKGTAWMAHHFHCDNSEWKVLDANVTDAERYEIFDPRNPINQRKREASKHASKDKKVASLK